MKLAKFCSFALQSSVFGKVRELVGQIKYAFGFACWLNTLYIGVWLVWGLRLWLASSINSRIEFGWQSVLGNANFLKKSRWQSSASNKNMKPDEINFLLHSLLVSENWSKLKFWFFFSCPLFEGHHLWLMGGLMGPCLKGIPLPRRQLLC